MTRLLRDWPFKLLALAIAITIWTAVALRDRVFVAATVPVEYVGLPRDLVLTGAPRTSAEVDIAVAQWARRRFAPHALRVRVDLRGVVEGEQFVVVSPADVPVPPGVRVRRVDPPRWPVRLARAAQGTLRVIPVVLGSPAPGHRVAAVRVEPIAVVVKGPRSTIEGRDSVETTPVDVAGRRSSVTQSVGLAFPDAVSALDDGSVRVTVDIQAESGTALQTEGLRK